ncbi:MAG: tyrosine-type recombinase/integrase [Marmoricola sp.]
MADMADKKADTKRRRQYASGSLYQRASDGRWFGAYETGFTRDGKRDRKTVSASTKAEAKRRLDKKLRELDRGAGPGKAKTTVKVWAEEWVGIAEKTNRPNTHTTDLAGVGWIVETIGHRPLAELEPADVRALHRAIEKTRSSSTAARYHGVLVRMLKAASVEGHRVPENVFLQKAPAAEVTDRDAIPTLEALAILKAATTLPHASRWVAALLQGMRQGECLGLTWDEITEDKFTLAWQLQPLPYKVAYDRSSGFRVPRGYEARQLEGQMHLVRPKSAAGWRQVPMLPVMWQALEAWRDLQPETPHGIVWPALDGSPADEHQDRREWFGIQGLAEVGHRAGRYYTVHEGRHTTGTLLRLLGVPDDIRFAIMGWSSVASSKTYEHVDALRMREMREALQGVAGVLELG